MKIIADANVLIRAVVRDDERQAQMAIQALRDADEIVIAIPALCEFVWVLERGYRRSRDDVALSIRELIGDPRTYFDRSAVMAGLTMLESGGDFADGVIAFEGKQFGGDVFVTFDRKAAKLIQASGEAVNLLDAT